MYCRGVIDQPPTADHPEAKASLNVPEFYLRRANGPVDRHVPDGGACNRASGLLARPLRVVLRKLA